MGKCHYKSLTMKTKGCREQGPFLIQASPATELNRSLKKEASVMFLLLRFSLLHSCIMCTEVVYGTGCSPKTS